MSGSQIVAPTDWVGLLIRLGTALLVGGALGLDRESRNKPAGLRTYMLVSLGSALFVLIPIQVGAAQVNSDALSRVFQGIAAGIGFIGGGVILREAQDPSGEVRVKGLTSAAAIWVASALGTAAGSGLIDLSLIGALLALFVLRVLKRFEHHL